MPYIWDMLKRSPMTRSQKPMRRSKWNKGTRISTRAADRKVWQRRLSLDWQARGMPNYCEAQFDVCINLYLTPAHSLDRGDIYTENEFREIIWACAQCHWRLDREMPKDERLRRVKEIIANRET